MSISARAANARETARQRDGRFGSYHLPDAGVDADLDMDLSWLEESEGGEFGVDPDFGAQPVLDTTTLVRDLAQDTGDWLRENAEDIGWDDGTGATARTRNQRQGSPLSLNAEAEERVRAVGSILATRAHEISGVDPEIEKTAYDLRLSAAQQDYDHLNDSLEQIKAECATQQQSEAVRWYAAMVAQGSVGTFTSQARAQVEAIRPGLADEVADIATRRGAAIERLKSTREGRDPETMRIKRQLADGYLAALAEAREVGGQVHFHDKSTKPARTAFEEAAQVYPTDWIARSNADLTDMLAKISKRRAHYAHNQVIKTKKKVPATQRVTTPWTPAEIEDYNSRSIFDSIEPVEWAYPDEQGRVEVERRRWETAYGKDPHRPPAGRGWEWHEWTDAGLPRGGWRRPSMRMATVAREVTPEILTNKIDPFMEGRSDTFSTAVHESAHRFEATVPQLKDLERSFLDRRCRDASGALKPKTSIYPGEYGRDGGFAHRYMGKEYDNGAREVLSCGTEALFGGRYGGLVGLSEHPADHDMRDFVLGTLACAGRRD